jgi:hypothetical protein
VGDFIKIRLAKLINFAGLPAESLMFSGLFFRQMQSIDIQRFDFVVRGGFRWVGIRLGWNLMVWPFFDV